MPFYTINIFCIQSTTMIHGDSNPQEKSIIKTLDGRSFNRIQMQIPFGESSIIFLTSDKPRDTMFWTNCLIDLVNHDIQTFNGSHMFPNHKGAFPWNDGLVKLPKIINYKNEIKSDMQRAESKTATRCIQRVLDGSSDAGNLNKLVDSFRETPKAKKYRKTSKRFERLEWVCPDVPDGGIVVWHGFHTTKADKGSLRPKATMFLDYTEKNTLSDDDRQHYESLIRKQPFDPGSGNRNCRGTKPTIEYNQAKGLPQAMVDDRQTTHKITGGVLENPSVGTLTVDRDTVIRRGYAVIVPVTADQNVPEGCFRWEMTLNELDMYHNLRREIKGEFERFLTYYIFEREMRYLSCWLSVHAKHEIFTRFWNFLKAQQDLFDPVTRKLNDDIRKHVQDVIEHLSYKGKALRKEQEWYDNRKEWDFTRRGDRIKMRSFYYHSWVRIFEKACLLDIRDGGTQEEVWWGLFGGQYKKERFGGQKAGQQVFNDKYFMNWRTGMGSQSGLSMCPDGMDINEFIESKVKEGFDAHIHTRNNQGGGKKIAWDSGMGPATTFMGGKHHVELQTGAYGCTLAKAFYKDPLVVFERFRIKTEAGWGAGHVDHSVQSRLTYQAPVVVHTPEQLDSIEEKLIQKIIKNNKRIKKIKERIESLSERRTTNYNDSVLDALKTKQYRLKRRKEEYKQYKKDMKRQRLKNQETDVNHLIANINIKF